MQPRVGQAWYIATIHETGSRPDITVFSGVLLGTERLNMLCCLLNATR